MSRLIKSFLRGFTFYRVVIPHKYIVRQKDINMTLLQDIANVQKDADKIEVSIEE
jgi:hypothetical protein